MRALTVWQPWADLIVTGVKDVENRTWQPPSTLPEWYLCECGQRERPRLGVTRLARHHHGAQEWGRMEPDGPFPFTVAVHAAKNWGDARGYAVAQEIDHAPGPLDEYERWHEALPRGEVVGTVDVVGCHHADDERGRERRGREGRPVETFDPCSRWAEPDAWHWQLDNPVALDEPIPARGQLGLWTLSDDVAAAVLAS